MTKFILCKKISKRIFRNIEILGTCSYTFIVKKLLLKMSSIRQYFKPIDQLPDVRGSLSRSIPPQVIASANRGEVTKAMEKSSNKKRGPYLK